MFLRQEARHGVGSFGVYLADTFLNPHLEGRMWYLYVLWIALMGLGILRLFGDRSWVLLAGVAVVMVWPWWGNFQRLQWIFAYVVFGFLARRYEARYLPRIRTIGLVAAVAYVPFMMVSRPEKLAVARVQQLLEGSRWPALGSAGVYGASTVAGVGGRRGAGRGQLLCACRCGDGPGAAGSALSRHLRDPLRVRRTVA